MTIPLYSDLTEPQRRVILRLAEQELRDPPGWMGYRLNRLTVRRLETLDLITTSEGGMRITARGMAYYRQHPQRPHFSDDVLREIIAGSWQGESQYRTAGRLGCTQAYVSAVLRGKFPRARRILAEMPAAPRRANTTRHDETVRRRALALRREGLRYADITAATGVPSATIGTWIKKAGMITEGHLDADTRREIVRCALKGMTHRELARHIGRSGRPVKDTLYAYYRGEFDYEIS